MSLELVAVILLALLYAFLNGLNDSSSIVATMIASRAYSQQTALWMTAAAEFMGPLVIGIAVAKTIGYIVVDPTDLTTGVILAAMLGAIIWILLTYQLGVPCSSSHALVGGLVGAVVLSAGATAIHLASLVKILLFLFVSPLIGLGIGYILLQIVMELAWKASPSINIFFKRFQIVTVIALGLSHGANDAPKTMGIITLVLITEKYQNVFNVPTWVILVSALAIAAGTAVGGQKLIRTVGGKFFKIEPVDAFTTQLSAAIVTFTASLLGGPVSATQIISSALMGVGASERPNKVRWTMAGDIGLAWVLTIPMAALIAMLSYELLTRSLK